MDESLLNHIFNDLRSKSADIRNKAASDLRLHLIWASHELPVERTAKYNDDVNRRINELVHSTDTYDKLGGIAAIDCLIDPENNEDNSGTKISRFANYLRNVIPSNDIEAMRSAAKALGRLAIPGGTITVDYVDFEVKRSLEWLQSDRQESRRQAAVLILNELAVYSPTIMYGYVPQILDLIWVAMRDQKVAIRIDAAVTLASCLKIIHQRDNQLRQLWYKKVYEEAQRGFRIGTADAIHGSLLTYKTLLSKALMDKGVSPVQSYYIEICDTVFRYKDHKDNLVRRTVLEIMADMAAFDVAAFGAKYLHSSMLHLLGQLRKDRERPSVFESIGLIAAAMKSKMNPYLDAIFTNIKEGLTFRGRAKREIEKPIFECITMLAASVTQALDKYISPEMLDLMFACGLSEHLLTTMINIVVYNKPILPIVQRKLLDIICLCLSGRRFHPPGSPEATLPTLPDYAREYREAMLMKDGPISEMKDSDLIALALRILGTFPFQESILSEFARNCVLSYIDDESADVRKAAALSCCHLLANENICHDLSAHSIRVVGDVLEKVLTVAISDPVTEIRREVLKAIEMSDTRFDPHLSQADRVRLLFTALNDEDFDVREVTVQIIGRLTMINPAYVMPPLRKTLIQLLTELEFSTYQRSKEESAKLIATLVRSTRKLIKPYVKPIIKVLLPKARDVSVGTSASVITALGELSKVGGEELIPYTQDLMPLILEVLQDQSSFMKRDAALRTLGQFSSSSGYVIEPLIDHPQLLGTLVSILKSEQANSVQRETVRVIGILGALDPYRYQMVERQNTDGARDQHAASTDVSLLMAGVSPSSDDYYATVVINILLGILRDPSLGTHHTAVIQAIMYIFKTLGMKCVPFLSQIIPGFLAVMRTSSVNMLEFYFQQLGILIVIVKQHVRNFLPQIFQVIHDFFPQSPNLQSNILSLIESLARALEGEFKMHIPVLLPFLLPVFDNDRSVQRTPTLKVLHAIIVFGANVEEYIHLILPSVVRLFENAPPHVEVAALETVGQMCKNVNYANMASRVVHPVLRVLNLAQHDEVKRAAMETITSLIYYMRQDMTVFLPVINKAVVANKIYHPQYEMLVTKIMKKEPFPHKLDTESDKKYAFAGVDEVSEAKAPVKKLPVNQEHLKAAWEASQKSTRDDWQEWIRRLSVELLKESPSHALRACAGLAGVYYPLAKDLFNVSFVSCWTELYEQYQDELVRALEIALMSPKIPPEILQTLLNLAEFMEHDDKALPMDIRTLGQYATRCHAYAKALHYKELEFIQEPTTPTIEALISINNQLQQNDAAIGILKHAQQHHDLQLKETWYEKLHRWEDALEAYSRRERDEPDSMEVTMGKMRCFHALGEWDLLSKLAQEKWLNSSAETKRVIAPLAAAAAWGLREWDRIEKYIKAMKPDSPDRSFFHAILMLHRSHFNEAANFIVRARDLLITELAALVGESYNRAYGVVVRVQMLSELEEIIIYKNALNDPEQQAALRKTWTKRLKGCQRNVDIWQRMLKVRALVVKPRQDMDIWIKFANLCRKSGRMGLAEKSLNSLIDDSNHAPDRDAINRAPPVVVYALLKFLWASGKHEQALNYLREFTVKQSTNLNLNLAELMAGPLPAELLIQADGGAQPADARPEPVAAGAPLAAAAPARRLTDEQVEQHTKLLARCFLKQGEWQIALTGAGWRHDSQGILKAYSLATYFDKKWYKAWHNWALANFEVVTTAEHQDTTPGRVETLMSSEFVDRYVVPAIQGFFKSIELSRGNSLQDILRLLTLWFRYGGLPEPSKAMGEGFTTISIDTWLEVIPQLIARIHQPNPIVRKSLHTLISDLGREHPQALVYPLTVAIKSDSVIRQRAASGIMDKMRAHSANLVSQAEVVIQELIRVTVLWHEQWHEGLEDASRLFFGDHDIERMFATLEPLHRMLERGPQTLREISFHQTFGRDLHEAYEWVLSFRRTNDMQHLNQAWDVYYSVFRRISRQLPQLQTLDLQYVSPKLLQCCDLELAVPGTYTSGATEKGIIRIMSFEHTFTVIQSKQRPRRLTIKGSDGTDYQYVLKGHEDIRQDSLVMQLFGLVNTLLSLDPECFKRHLNIQQYPAIPLSPKSGLLGWVKDSDTFHVLIREYRENRKILLNIEHRIMQQMAPDYERLTLIQKVEVFMYALDNTTGQDLYRVLWLKSRSSEAWLDRRTTYTRSLALMSMVGYILGLGDRHPSNLMLDRYTGKVVHIDFGDCFEAAILREKFPEKVPFRLTRMLTYAMEVSGIEGSFRLTCENVMRVLRDNKESLMAILEAFAHDPLINWGFNLPQAQQQQVAAQIQRTASQAAMRQPAAPAAPAAPGPQSVAVQMSLQNSIIGEAMMSASTRDRRGSILSSSVIDRRRPQVDEEEMIRQDLRNQSESRNVRATVVLKRISEKLTGHDFRPSQELDVPNQVDKLIQQATSVENLCQHYVGWCSFW
ncbi:armadillo-type protein [Dipodascopsis tothii]|uniref:armadillo-type protein n=1 Tax=Dipodascopsis tothii TaxID=44089 RepID=UPI0034CD2011